MLLLLVTKAGASYGSMRDSTKIIVSFGALRAVCKSPLVLTTNDRADVSGRNAFGMSEVLGYARVSTGDQDVAGQTLRLEQAGAIKVFTDVRSGKSMDRPGLAELFAYARRGDTLAVVRLDRLGRSLAELLATVAALKERGIALLSLEEKIDTSSAAGELVFHVFGVIAHFERRLIAERTKDGTPPPAPKVSAPAESRSTRKKCARRSNSSRRDCRQPPRPINSVLDDRPSVVKNCRGIARSDCSGRRSIPRSRSVRH